MITATLIEGKELLETVIASTVAGVGVTFAFSIAIWGVARFVDLSRDDRPLAAAAAALAACLAFVATATAVALGIIAMTNK
jgi:hypothetical protein